MAEADQDPSTGSASAQKVERGKTVHGEPANAGHRVLAPDDAEVEAYLETALHAPVPTRGIDDRPDGVEPDYRAFTQMDVLNVVRRLASGS